MAAAGLLLAALLAWSLSWGAAGLLHDRARQLAPPGTAMPAPERLAAAGAALTQARRLDPLSPQLRQTAARLLELQAMDPALTGMEADMLLARAESLYRETLARRPTWPYAAGALARVQLKRGRHGPGLERTLALAVRLGRFEPGLQRGLLATGFTAWPLLSVAERARLGPLIAAGLRLQPETVLALAARHGRRDAVAPYLDGDERLRVLARRWLPDLQP
jgi:hypothetical protein